MDTGRAWIALDRAALRHNVDLLRGLLPPGCALMPAVKADAYGHGAVPLALELNALGVDAFCVAAAEEGARLREAGVRGEVLVLGWTHPENVPLLARYGLTQTVTDPAYAAQLDAQGRPLTVQLKLDTGMHRLGAAWDRQELLIPIFSLKNLRVTGAFTHLCADASRSPADLAFTYAQARRFRSALAALARRGCVCPKVHLLSSYGLVNYPELGGDYARVGIALYGLLSARADREACPLDLRPILSLNACVAQVHSLPAGEGAGYDLAFTPDRDSRVAALTIGYADGLPRSFSCGGGAVLLHGRRAPIVGRICMDQTLVDVTDVPGVAPGDRAVLIGSSGGAEITAYDWADRCGTITNEIVSRLGARLERFLV